MEAWRCRWVCVELELAILPVSLPTRWERARASMLLPVVRSSRCASANAHSPDINNRRTAGRVWLANPRSAGNRCGHRRRTRILVETVVEAVVKPNGFLETVFNVAGG